MKILLLLKRGLGNQLFQYAAGLFFAKKYGATLEIIREPDNLAISFGHPRPFMLSNFCVSTPFREGTLWDRLMCSVAPIKKPVAASARFASRTAVYRQHFLEDGTFLPELSIPRSTNNLYLEGNFQAYQYAEDMEQSVRMEFRLREPAVGRNLDALEQIRAVENSVSLHVRRGDYTVRKGGPQPLSLGYYANAMQALLERVDNPTFFVFSDDIAFTRENLPNSGRMVFVDHNDEANGHEDLRLMSSCRHNIIANSTFSWWGAWLNPNPAKIVCAPQSWHNLNADVPYSDLIPPSWKPIQAGNIQS
jgi:Glycosyl transferase family 11